MLKRCGFRISNYHNKVRIVLLEKEIAFEEDDTCRPSQVEAYLARSSQVKPYLRMLGERPAFHRVNEDRKAATRQ